MLCLEGNTRSLPSPTPNGWNGITPSAELPFVLHQHDPRLPTTHTTNFFSKCGVAAVQRRKSTGIPRNRISPSGPRSQFSRTFQTQYTTRARLCCTNTGPCEERVDWDVRGPLTAIKQQSLVSQISVCLADRTRTIREAARAKPRVNAHLLFLAFLILISSSQNTANIVALKQALHDFDNFMWQTGIGALPTLPLAAAPPMETKLIEDTNRSIQVLYEKLKRSQESAAVVANLLGAPDMASRK